MTPVGGAAAGRVLILDEVQMSVGQLVDDKDQVQVPDGTMHEVRAQLTAALQREAGLRLELEELKARCAALNLRLGQAAASADAQAASVPNLASDAGAERIRKLKNRVKRILAFGVRLVSALRRRVLPRGKQ